MQLQGLLESRCVLAREKNVLGTNVVFAPSCPVGKSHILWLCPRGSLPKDSLPKGKLGSNITFFSSTFSVLFLTCWLTPHWCCNAEVRRYGRTTSAGGTTTVATPAPHSAATALAGAAASKGQAPTAPVQASALSASLADTTQLPSSSTEDITDSGSAGQQQQHQPHSNQVSTVPNCCYLSQLSVTSTCNYL